MAVASYILPRFKAIDDYGRPMVGAKLYTYQNNTTTPAATYQDAQQSAANTNPIVLDASGEAIIYLLKDQIYTFVLKDQDDVSVWSQDDVTGAASPQDLAAVVSDLAAEGGSALVGFKQSGAGMSARTAQAKMRELLSLADSSGNTAVFLTEANTRKSAAYLQHGEVEVESPLALVPNGALVGDGSQSLTLRRMGAGSMFSSALQNYVTLKGLTIDMQHSVTGESGHGLTSTGDYVRVEDVTVKDLGGTSAGTGLLVFKSGATRPEGPRFINNTIFGDPAAPASFGWIFESTRHGFASGIYAQDMIGYAHELKNDAIYNNLTHLTAYLSNWALAHGQDTVGVDGADFNVGVGILGNACDGGWIVGEGTYNLTSAMIVNTTGAPGREADTSLVRLSGSAAGNAACDLLGLGDFTQTVLFSGNRNYARILTHDTSAIVLRISAGSRQNVLEVAHPGNRTSIRTAIDDLSGNGLTGSTANVVHSPATGERIGSISGYFSDVLGQSGAAFNGNHRWRKEHSQYVIESLSVPGNNGDIVGLVQTIPGNTQYSKLLFTKSTSAATDFFTLGVGGADVFIANQSAWYPAQDNTKSFGTAPNRSSVVYSATGAINTSDEREKTEVAPLTASELSAAQDLAREIGSYKWLAAIAAKGADARFHIGMTVQRAIQIMDARGLDPMAYGFICYDSWEVQDPVIDSEGNVQFAGLPAGDRYSFRMDELLAFIIRGVVATQDQHGDRLAALEGRP